MMRSEPSDTAQQPDTSGVRETTSIALLQGSRLLVIRHGQDAYQLRLTANGKLILTK
jgi:hemin uptake protein HemP